MKMICVNCGHTLMLDRAYANFEGEVKCFVCKSMLVIKTEGGEFKKIKLAADEPDASG